MTALCCPSCGHTWADGPAAHRGELERQFPARAGALRTWAKADPGGPPERWDEFVAWRGMIWTKVRLRKPARCEVTGADLPPGAWAWRQLSEVRDRDLRVAAAVWESL